MLQRPLLTTLLALSLATLVGCANPSVITLTDGRETRVPLLPLSTQFELVEQLQEQLSTLHSRKSL